MTWRPLSPDGGTEDPRPVVRSLNRLALSLGVPPVPALRAVFSDWEGLVGQTLAVHTQPLFVRDGALIVGVDHPSWATEVRWLAPQLLARLREVGGATVATRVEVRVGRPGRYKPGSGDAPGNMEYRSEG